MLRSLLDGGTIFGIRGTYRQRYICDICENIGAIFGNMMGVEVKVDIKLTQLKLAAQRTAKIQDSGKREAIERHLKALKSIISETDAYK